MNNITQSLQLIRSHLLSESTITSIVSDRIYTTHFYDFENINMKFPLIIVADVGGVGNYGRGYQKLDIELYCYAKSSSQKCKQIYDQVYENLHGYALKNANIQISGLIYESIRPSSGFNTSAKAYFCTGNYTFNTAG